MILRKLLSFSLTFFILYSSSSANAAVEKIHAKDGEEFVVSIKLSSKEDESKGINVYSMKIDYDESIFESLSESNFKALGSWSDVIYNSESGKLT